ncbi:MAG: YidC/Oxa1 family membrane protein insertase [Patescibacteria group bacterium]|nr:YidC/Oxa1 family membrane protein insertase [Patescibacteria group bacterium]
MFIIENIFITFIYQPFFNLLVAIYYGLARFNPHVDMGIAVIIFTIIFRIIILPLSLASGRTENEKVEMMKKLAEIKDKYAHDPVAQKAESRKIFQGNKRVVIAETIDIGIQAIIALMLLRIFSTGLEGADFHLLYHGIPKPSEPFNMMFLNSIDLSRPSVPLNILNSIVIFIAEALSIVSTARPANREDRLALFAFPVIVFIYLYFMPAGKKLFIITTLLFSIGLMLVQTLLFWYHKITGKLESAFYSKVSKQAADNR